MTEKGGCRERLVCSTGGRWGPALGQRPTMGTGTLGTTRGPHNPSDHTAALCFSSLLQSFAIPSIYREQEVISAAPALVTSRVSCSSNRQDPGNTQPARKGHPEAEHTAAPSQHRLPWPFFILSPVTVLNRFPANCLHSCVQTNRLLENATEC